MVLINILPLSPAGIIYVAPSNLLLPNPVQGPASDSSWQESICLSGLWVPAESFLMIWYLLGPKSPWSSRETGWTSGPAPH